MLGGDTDTNAAIVGGMMGALHGVAAIPEYMRRPVEEFDCTKTHPQGYVRNQAYSTRFTKHIVTKLVSQ
jgi:ADP-ribosyl-[dinitrogen reductase] hydrolase